MDLEQVIGFILCALPFWAMCIHATYMLTGGY